MKRLKTSLLAVASCVALLSSNPALALHEEDAAAPTAAAAETAGGNGPAMWKVADEDTTIYLFGTVHVLPDGVQWMTPAIDAALDSSQALVTEIDMGPDTTIKAQQLIAANGMLPEGTTLRSLMSEEQRTADEAAMTSLELDPGTFDGYEPWVATINLSMLPLLKAGYQIDNGVEEVLLKTADHGLERGALETIEFQLGLFDNAPLDAQLSYLDAAVEAVDEVIPMINTMVDDWVTGDPDALAEMLNEEMAETPEVAEALLYMRNANWAEWIDNRLDQPGTVFIAVGAGHLAGTRSVQDYLAARGIASTRVQ